jgi:uncharacterized membrane protein
MSTSTTPRPPAPPELGPTDEPRWHASVAVLLALALYVTLPNKLTLGPAWVFPVLVMVLLVPLSLFAPRRHQETPLQRGASIALIIIINLFNVASVALLIYSTMFEPHGKTYHAASGQELLIHGTQIWITNIIVYALWYWEIDGGGPEPRAHATSAMEFAHADFLFPQMSGGNERVPCIEKNWKPFFLDYAYVAFTNALAFSPADSMPLTRFSKTLMTAEAITSFVTIAVVLARAVGIIG